MPVKIHYIFIIIKIFCDHMKTVYVQKSYFSSVKNGVCVKGATFSRKHSKEFFFSKANLLKAADW